MLIIDILVMDYFKNKFVDIFDFFGSPNYNHIVKNIYIGNYKASNLESINKVPFHVIINCTPKLPFYSNKTINYRLNVKDNLSFHSNILLVQYIHKILPIIHKHIQENKKILIHCRAGMQRSAAVTACYLMKYHNLNSTDAMEYVKRKRPVAFLSGSNFYITIKLFEKIIINNVRKSPDINARGNRRTLL